MINFIAGTLDLVIKNEKKYQNSKDCAFKIVIEKPPLGLKQYLTVG